MYTVQLRKKTMYVDCKGTYGYCLVPTVQAIERATPIFVANIFGETLCLH